MKVLIVEDKPLLVDALARGLRAGGYVVVHATRADILHGVWADATPTGGDNMVVTYVGYLRGKIDNPFGTNTIQTIRGVGYRLNSRGSAAGS